MPYIPKGQRGHDTWIGLAELLEIVQAESECSIEAAREQIRSALADSAIWPLDWEPAPPPSTYCRTKFGPLASHYGKPIRPPPPCSKNLANFQDLRSALHWHDVEIDWEKGRVLDDFEREAYKRIGIHLVIPGNIEPTRLRYPQQKPELRILLLDREACEQLWLPRYAVPSRAVAPQSPSGILTTAAAKAEQECEAWIKAVKERKERPTNKETAFEAARNVVGDNLSQKAFDRAWAKGAPTEWKEPGRRKQ